MSSNNSTVRVKQEETNNHEPQFDYFPLRACTKEDIEETRYHIMKFHSMKPVHLSKDFENPTRLHRKDPKNLQFQLSLKELEEKRKEDEKKNAQKIQRRQEYIRKKGIKESEMTDEQIDEKIELESMSEEERKKKLEQKKKEEEAEKLEKEKEERLKHIAPDGGARKRKQVIKRKTRQIRAYDEDKRRLRYEEFYPWVLEDYDAKQAWIGNYEAGVTDNFCLLVLDNANKCFKLVPLDKYYRFTPRNKYATLTLEEAEAKMNKGSNGQRWLMRKMADEAASGQRVDLRYRKLQTTSKQEKEEDPTVKKSEDEDMDFDDEFQDDEEAPIIQGNEAENRLVEGKMKKNMLRANNLIEHDEDSDSDLDDLFEVRKVDKEGKKLRKALAQNAMNEVYDTDDEEDNNPYLSESEIEEDDSDGEEDKIITIKKEPGLDGKLREEITVKKEDGDTTEITSTTRQEQRKVFVSKYSDGVLILKAPKIILMQFPEGEWNPTTAIRRKRHDNFGEEEHPPLKKIKLKLGHKKTNSQSPDSRFHQISKADVDELLRDGPIPLTTLVRSLRTKMSKDPNARSNLKHVLKGHFTLKNKKVYRKGD